MPWHFWSPQEHDLEEIRKRQTFSKKATLCISKEVNALRVTSQGSQDQTEKLNEKLDKPAATIDKMNIVHIVAASGVAASSSPPRARGPATADHHRIDSPRGRSLQGRGRPGAEPEGIRTDLASCLMENTCVRLLRAPRRSA